jgi:hypothetical protein
MYSTVPKISSLGLASTVGLLLFTLLLVFPHSALAIPSFAAQTGQPCSSCHVGAFGPQLKPYGRDFKLYGYVTSDRPDDNLQDNWEERFSTMMQTSFTHTNTGQSPPAADGVGPNDNFTLDQVSVYYGGRITSTIGAIQELSYDGVNHSFFWDALDVRHAWEGTILGTDYVGGVLVGNQLGNTSLWNSTPPNNFPYNSSRIAPTPQAGTIFDDSLNGQILGPGAYISWNDWIYAEVSTYFPLSHNVDQAVGNPLADKYDGVIPFWHVALQHDFDHHEHYIELGTFGVTADKYPGGLTTNGPVTTVGPRDHISDVAVEANYQWLADLHNMVSAHATYIRENQDLNATFGQGGSSNPSDNVNEFKADVTYSIDDTYVPTVQYFKTTGSTDALLYTSSPNGNPNSEGYTIDLAYVPFGKPDSPGYNWGNARVALEYTGYTEFNGTSRHASDNNTIFLNFWFILDPLVPIFSHDKSAASDITPQ